MPRDPACRICAEKKGRFPAIHTHFFWGGAAHKRLFAYVQWAASQFPALPRASAVLVGTFDASGPALSSQLRRVWGPKRRLATVGECLAIPNFRIMVAYILDSRIKRVKCERQNAASTTCVACSVKGEACSLSMSSTYISCYLIFPPPDRRPCGLATYHTVLPLSAGVSQCPPGVPQRSPPHCADATPGTTPHVGVQSAREPSAATGSSSASRSAWLDTVLAPSPQ